MARELEVAVFLPTIAILSGGIERMLKTMEYAPKAHTRCTVYLERGLVRDREAVARLENLEERGVISVEHRNGKTPHSPTTYDGILIPSEFWTGPLARAKGAGVRGPLHIEFQQLPFVGTLDVLRARGGGGMTPLDIVRFPLHYSRVLGDALPFSTFRIAACLHSVRKAMGLRDARFMATTPVVRRHLQALGFSRNMFVPRVPLGIDAGPIRETRDRPDELAFDAAFAARFHPHKGFLDLPRIAALLKQRRGEGVRIAVCGSPSSPRYSKQFEDLVTSYRVENNLVMMGRLPRSELYRTIRRSHALLYPSYVDSFSITVLESLSLRTPVFAYGIDALKLIWGPRRGVYLSPVGDAQALALSYLRFREETQRDELVKDLSTQSEQLLAEYTWEATVHEERRFIEGATSSAEDGIDAATPMTPPR